MCKSAWHVGRVSERERERGVEWGKWKSEIMGGRVCQREEKERESTSVGRWKSESE